MALNNDITLVHMDALSTIDKVEQNLKRLRRTGDDSQQSLRITDELAHQAVRLRRRLRGFFERERLELFPRIRRICGPDTDEIERLLRHQHRVVESLDQFISTLPEEGGPNGYNRQQLATLEHQFNDFIERFEQRCDVERAFYQTYSTILFPGGVATD